MESLQQSNMNDAAPPNPKGNDPAQGTNDLHDTDADDDANTDDNETDDDRKMAGTTTTTNDDAENSYSSNCNDDTIMPSSSNDVFAGMAQPKPSSYQLQIKKRNALYSKRKYYKKKNFIDNLKQKQELLIRDNHRLRESNEQLETMLRRAKEAIVMKQKQQDTLQFLTQQQQQQQQQRWQQLPSSLAQLHNEIPSLPSNPSALSSITRALRQQQSYPLTSSATATGNTIGLSSIYTGRVNSTSSQISSELQLQAALNRHAGLNHDALANLIRDYGVNSNDIPHTNSPNNQQFLPTASMMAAASRNNDSRLTQLISNIEEREASLNRNIGIYSEYSSSLLPSTATPTRQTLESPLLSLLLQQELTNRNDNTILNQPSVSSLPYDFLHLHNRFGNNSIGRDLSVRDVVNNTLCNDATIAGDIGNHVGHLQLDSSSITVPPPTHTLRQLLVAQQLQQQQLEMEQRRSATIANVAAGATPTNQQNQSDSETNTALIEYYLSIARGR